MTEEWTKWIAHDGKTCPSILQLEMVVEFQGLLGGVPSFKITTITTEILNLNWADESPHTRLIRFRIKKPKALQQLIKMVKTLPVGKELETVK